jgi:hypothetical protein
VDNDLLRFVNNGTTCRQELVVLLPNADLRNGTFSTRVLKNKRVRYSPPVQGWPGGSGKIEWVIGHQDSEAYATTKTLLPYVLAAVNRKKTKPSSRYPQVQVKDNQGGLQAITRKNPVYAGYTVETHNYLSANRSQTAS